jgi:hypothetical protein
MDEDAYWKTLKPFPFIKDVLTKRPKSIQLYLDKIRSLGENELQEEAEKSAQYTLRRISENLNFFINIIAGAMSDRILDKWALAASVLHPLNALVEISAIIPPIFCTMRFDLK